MFSLNIRVVGGKDLPDLSPATVLDPYLSFHLEDNAVVKNTRVINNSTQPFWNQDIKFEIMSLNCIRIYAKLMNRNIFEDDTELGSIIIEPGFKNLGQTVEDWYTICQDKKNNKESKIHLMFQVTPFSFGAFGENIQSEIENSMQSIPNPDFVNWPCADANYNMLPFFRNTLGMRGIPHGINAAQNGLGGGIGIRAGGGLGRGFTLGRPLSLGPNGTLIPRDGVGPRIQIGPLGTGLGRGTIPTNTGNGQEIGFKRPIPRIITRNDANEVLQRMLQAHMNEDYSEEEEEFENTLRNNGLIFGNSGLEDEDGYSMDSYDEDFQRELNERLAQHSYSDDDDDDVQELSQEEFHKQFSDRRHGPKY